MNAVLDAIFSRRSIRSYQQRQIPRGDLQTILEAGSYAPCAMGTQSWNFFALQSSEAIQKVNTAIRLALLSIPVTSDINPYLAAYIEKAHNQNADFLYGAPTLVIVSTPKDNPNAQKDTALALGSMMLAAHSLGIGSCWLNQIPGFAHTPPIRELFAELNIPETHTVYGTLSLGYAAEPAKQADPRKDVIRII